jgi:pyrroline-5-carboxylate reductase
MELGILGLGKMGEALARGLHAEGVLATTRTEASAEDAAERLGIPVGTDNHAVAAARKTLVVATKPHHVAKVLEEIAPALTPDHLLISIAAAVTTAEISERTGGVCPVVRAMPNTPAIIGLGITALAPHPSAQAEHLQQATAIFETIGKVVVVDETLMDGVTGLSGCGPAYVYMIIEALSEAGVMVGIPRKTSLLLAVQTILGAAHMVLERGEHPAALKDEVTTPAGCTIDGLMQLEEGKLRATLIRAVVAATERSKTLAKPH